MEKRACRINREFLEYFILIKLKLYFEFLKGKAMNLKLGRLNKWIEPIRIGFQFCGKNEQRAYLRNLNDYPI